jgi:hypothetical protein
MLSASSQSLYKESDLMYVSVVPSEQMLGFMTRLARGAIR